MLFIKSSSYKKLKILELPQYSKRYYIKKRKRKISFLRSPHVFSKFKQQYMSVDYVNNFLIDYSLCTCCKVHKVLESEYLGSFTIVKRY